MSRIDVLKKQNKELDFGIVDILSLVIKKPKYLELFINLLKKTNVNDDRGFMREEYGSVLERYYGIPKEVTKNLPIIQLGVILRVLEELIRREDMTLFLKFIEFNERFLIKKNDLSTYKSFEELKNQVSLTELALVDKELEKHVLKIYEDDENLLVKPLSWDASKKYGSNTKWCTTAIDDPHHFYRYAFKGVLIYYINKKTGDKTAVFQSLNVNDEEISFWNSADNRIDSMMSNVPVEILKKIKHELLNKVNKNNLSYLTEKQRLEQIEILKKRGYDWSYLQEEGSSQPVPVVDIMRDIPRQINEQILFVDLFNENNIA